MRSFWFFNNGSTPEVTLTNLWEKRESRTQRKVEKPSRG